MPGKISFRRAAAHSALGFPPSRQSANWKSGCRTGFEKLTRAESTSVILRTPQPCRARQRRPAHKGGAHHERARDVAPERARAEEQAARARDLVEVERGQDPPAHQLQVQVDRLVREPAPPSVPCSLGRARDAPHGVHHRREVRHARAHLARAVLLPADDLRAARVGLCRGSGPQSPASTAPATARTAAGAGCAGMRAGSGAASRGSPANSMGPGSRRFAAIAVSTIGIDILGAWTDVVCRNILEESLKVLDGGDVV
jgi:hypothetical protein